MTYPTDPGFESIEIMDAEATLSSEALNLRTQTRSLNGQRWEISGSYPLLTRAEAAVIVAFKKLQRGANGTFTLVLPEYSDTSGTATGTVLVNDASGFAIDDTAITIDGLTGILQAGDFIKFANHDKVYMVVADRDGAGALTISPPLRAAVVDNEAITYNSVPFTVRFAKDKQSFSVGTHNRTRIKSDFIEAV